MTVSGLFAFLTLLTIGYACLIRLGLGIFDIFFNPDTHGVMPLLSRITAEMSTVIVWQILAFVSLFACMLWAFFRSRSSHQKDSFILPAALHITWLATSLVWNAVGALYPFIHSAQIFTKQVLEPIL